MAINFGSNIASLRSQNDLSKATEQVSAIYERLSSGMRINKASDDAAGLAIVTNLKTDVRVYTQGVRNVNDGISYLNIAQGGLSTLSNLVTRQMELSEEAANGTYTTQQRKSMNTEANALVSEFNRIIQSTQFNGVNVFDTSNGDLRIQAGYGVTGSVDILTNTQLARIVGNGTFQTAQGYTARNSQGVVIGDVNGDGINDIISSGGTDPGINVLIGNGNGTFLAPATYYTGAAGFALQPLFADLNGDGIKDIATVSSTTGGVSILFGNSNGTFKSAVTYAGSGGGSSHSIVSADVNGDGIADIVTTDSALGTYNVYTGNSNGTFKASVSYAGAAYSLAAVDLQNNGIKDLITTGGGFLNIAMGNGDGTFKAALHYLNGVSNSVGLSYGDFNGDGNIDIAVAGQGASAVSVLINNGDGTFQTAVTYNGFSPTVGIQAADMNGDGISDLVTTDNTGIDEIRFGNGDGTFKASTSFVAPGGGALAVGDLTGNGVPDIVQTNSGPNQVQVILQNTTTTDTIASLNLLTSAGALQSLTTSQATLQRINSELGLLGANQSRLQIASNMLSNSSVNFQSAESRIMDADVAEESSNLVSTQILQRASVAVLAQANQEPALALKLLQ